MTPIVINTAVDGVVAGTIISDQIGTLTIAQSFDGVHFDSTVTTVVLAAGVGQSFSVAIIGPFVQLSFTNGGTPQTYMRLFARAFGTKMG